MDYNFFILVDISTITSNKYRIAIDETKIAIDKKTPFQSISSIPDSLLINPKEVIRIQILIMIPIIMNNIAETSNPFSEEEYFSINCNYL